MAEVAQPEAEQEASSGKIRAPFRADIEFMDEFGGAVFPGLDRGLRAGREFYERGAISGLNGGVYGRARPFPETLRLESRWTCDSQKNRSRESRSSSKLFCLDI